VVIIIFCCNNVNVANKKLQGSLASYPLTYWYWGKSESAAVLASCGSSKKCMIFYIGFRDTVHTPSGSSPLHPRNTALDQQPEAPWKLASCINSKRRACLQPCASARPTRRAGELLPWSTCSRKGRQWHRFPASNPVSNAVHSPPSSVVI
jgi:hypothetical protein